MKKVVFLVDMNSFFISCEMSKNKSLKGKPAAVAGDPKRRSGIILAANYEARKFGVKTTMTLGMAKTLCPDIIFVPPDQKFYNLCSRKVMKILARYSPIVEQNSIDEAWLDLTGCEKLFGSPLEIANQIMQDIINELDLWCSIGISENKFLAKMASEMKKPLGITELWSKDVQFKLWTLKVRQMYGIGRKTEEKLNKLGILTIGDIAKFNKSLLVKAFGKYGEHIYQLANGIDLSPVLENPAYESKSIGRSTTLLVDTTDIDFAKKVIMQLAEEVGAEARKHNYKGKTVSIVIKYDNFQSITRQKSILPTYLTKDIYLAGFELLELNWDINKPVRLLGITLAKVDTPDPVQMSFFDLNDTTNTSNTNKKEENLEKTLDAIRNKFGNNIVKRANLIE
jgi:DNA polymerase-4